MKIRFIALFLVGWGYGLDSGTPAQAQPRADSAVQRCAPFRESDSLAVWLDCHWEVANEWFEATSLSLEVLERALHHMWRAPRTQDEAESLLWIQLLRGWQLFQLGDVPASIEAYEAALHLHETYAFAEFDACEYLFKPLGSHYIRLGDNPRAQLLLLRAVAECPAEDGEVMGGLYNNLGLAYWNESDFAEAEKWFRRGLELKGVPPLQERMLWHGLAQTLFDQGKLAQARRALQQAARPLPDAHADARYDELQARIWWLRARIGRASGEVPTAGCMQWLERSARLFQKVYPHSFHRTLGKVLVAQARLALESGQLDQAEALLLRVIEGLGDTQGHRSIIDNTLAEAWDVLAAVWLARFRKKPDAATASQALEALQQAHHTDFELRQMLRFEGARLLQQTSWHERTARALELLAWLARHGQAEQAPWQAIEWMEQSRARVLADAVWTHQRSSQATSPEQAWARLRRHLAYYEQQRKADPQHQERWLDRQRRTLAALDSLERMLPQLSKGMHPLGLDAELLQRHVGPEGGLCYYFWSEAQLFCAWYSPEAGLHMATCPTDKLALLEPVVEAMRQPGTPLPRHQLEALADLLLPPAVRHLDKLLVFPDGPLHFLPFSALLTDENGLPRMPVRYGFSLAVLELAARKTPTSGYLTGWAPFAKAGRDSLAPLPHTLSELEALPPQSQWWIGAAATRAAFRQTAPGAHLIHLATHAQGGTAPAIAFADSSLLMPELYRMELQAALVVLSACETLPGKEVKGEGVMGLARAFAYAGARGLVASLWQVDDARTAELWKAFYRHLERGLAPAPALWQAQRDFLSLPGRPDYQRHPWYWAGFVYLGPEQVHVGNPQSHGLHPWWPLALAAVILSLFFVCRKARAARRAGGKA